jgi:sulfonate transport system permease protein
MSGAWQKAFGVLLFPSAVLLIWEIFVRNHPNRFFAEPSRIIDTFLTLASWSWIEERVVPTLAVVGAGYFVGSVSGVILGALVGMSPIALRVVGPVAVLLRSTPSAAIIPVILAVFGLGVSSLIAAVATAVGFLVLLVTMVSVARTDSMVLDQAALLRMSAVESLLLLRLPAATGKILVGLQAALQVALLVTVTVEIMAGGQGMGGFTAEALNTMRLNHLWVSVLIMGIVGFIFHEMFHWAEKRLAPWHFAEKAGTS